MINIELAHLEGGNLFLLAVMAEDTPLGDAAALEYDGRSYDLTGNMRRFLRRDPLAPDQLSQAVLIAKPIAAPSLTDRGEAARLVGRDIFLTLSTASGAPMQFQVRLKRQPEAFRQFIASHERVLRNLLEQAGRQEAYLLETDIWPEAADREEVADLVELSPSVHLEIDFCCIPIPNVLVFAGYLVDPLSELKAIDVFHGDGDIPFERRLIRFERLQRTPDPRDLRTAGGFVIVLNFDEATVPHDDFVLLLATKRRVWTKSLRPRARLERGIDGLASHLVGMDADTRLLILEEVAALAGKQGNTAAGLRLMAMQVGAVEDLPPSLARPEIGLRLTVDLAAHILGHGVFLLGWAHLVPEVIRAVELRLPTATGGVRADISGDWVHHRRLDVWRALKDEGELILSDQLGFICVARTPGIGAPGAGYLAIRLVDDSVRRMKLRVQFCSLDPFDAIKPLLAAFAQTHLSLGALLDRHIGPAVAAAWAQRRRPPRSPEIKDYGETVASPECSLIIPLYGRYDFMEHQIARFVDDPALRGQEIIYVVDDPAIYDPARLLAAELGLLHGLPFRLVYGNRNLGYAGATNLGAKVARGRYLLLMNSDVIPRRFGWLAELIAAYRRLPNAGAVAPKLLYEDNSVQHAGMQFVRYPLWADMWVNEHPGKGLADQTGPEPIECDAVTGACMLIEADMYRRAGGLSEDYIIGDFEDSDLCLKLVRAGRRNWVIPSVALYHLERQSQDFADEPNWRTNLSLLNCWTHHQRWDETISRLVTAR
jgi:GT2 family glycosyltransferase